MLLWRLIGENFASLQELETYWSLDDVLRATAILNARAHIERSLAPKPEK